MSSKVGIKGPMAKSTTEIELMAAVLGTKESVFCSNTTKELGFGTRFDGAPLHNDNISTLLLSGNGTYGSRVKHVALRYSFIQGLVKTGRIDIHT